MIINLRGANGSGKSTVARSLLTITTEVNLAQYATPKGDVRHVTGYHVASRDLVIVGPYRTPCGGCDAIKTQDLVKESVRLARGLATNVFFEGVIISTLFSGYKTLSQELRQKFDDPLIWVYLDTPLEVCLARIQERNGGKPIKEELVADKIKSIASTRRKAVEAQERVMVVDHLRAVETITELFA